MITFLIIIFAVAVIITLLGEIFGKEPFMGCNFLTFPFKIQFERKWVNVIYRICWVVLIIALFTDVTLLLYSAGVLTGSGWLLLPLSLAVAVCLFIPLSMVAAIILIIVMIMFCLIFDREGWENI